MLRLRVFPSAARSLRRTNASLAPVTEASLTPPPPAPPAADALPVVSDGAAVTKSGKGKAAEKKDTATEADDKDTAVSTDDAANSGRPRIRPRRFPAKRPSINLKRPREWNRPLAPGVLPAYDEALRLLRADSRTLKDELEGINARIEAAPEGEDVEKLRKKAAILEVQSEINLPDVRWRFRNKMVDMSTPVHRHLAEQKWRKEGGLDLLMERIHQMNVVPDIIPSLHPSLDLRATFPEAPPEDTYQRTRVKRKIVPVEAGMMLFPEQTRKPPTVYVTAFHTDVRYYTLLMVDPDVPAEETQSYQTYLHWLQPNIPLSALDRRLSLPNTPHSRYIPPHPQQGTPYHRYVLLLLPHADPTATISVPTLSDEQRVAFDVRAFAEHYGLDGAKGGGAFMWREVWNEEVSRIYRDTLKLPEPRYGKPRKPDPYAEVKATGRYPSPSLSSRESWRASHPPARESVLAPVQTTADAAEAEVAALYAAADAEVATEGGEHLHANATEEANNEVAMGLAPEEAEQDRVVGVRAEAGSGKVVV